MFMRKVTHFPENQKESAHLSVCVCVCVWELSRNHCSYPAGLSVLVQNQVIILMSIEDMQFEAEVTRCHRQIHHQHYMLNLSV